ncbi:MAG: sulfotransferase, partial [Alphaproteobacteria bacterium]
LAFSQIAMQKQLSQMEDRLYAARIPDTLDRPVFVTSLPRAGTTLILELISALPEFATHTYRQMPFVLMPLLWQKFAGSLQRAGTPTERAHADGMEISFDSPEAFEEVLWTAFWSEHYRDNRIQPWIASEREPEFEEFFQAHMRKIIALQGGEARRYISKNNANIARLDLLSGMFDDAIIVIPVRNPWDHTRSLRRQHERFLKLHAEDKFGLDYMKWLGHFEFGAALQPINFDGWLNGWSGTESPSESITEEFWLSYWIHAFESVLNSNSRALCFVDYDQACINPKESLGRLAGCLGADDPQALIDQSHRFRAPSTGDRTPFKPQSELEKRAHAIHRELQARAQTTG